METLRKLLNAECTYRMKNETMEQFLGLISEQVELKEGEPVIAYGRFDDNVYIVKSGIIRTVYFDGLKEIHTVFRCPELWLYHTIPSTCANPPSCSWRRVASRQS